MNKVVISANDLLTIFQPMRPSKSGPTLTLVNTMSTLMGRKDRDTHK